MKPIIGKKKPYIYAGVEHDSKEEIYIRWWLSDLKDAGIVLDYEYQPESFILSMGLPVTEVVQLKTKVKYVQRSLLSKRVYTPDFSIMFHDGKYKSLFTEDFDDSKLTRNPKKIPLLSYHDECIIDVKPIYEPQSSKSQVFRLNQSFLFETMDVYVHAVIYQKLFAATFTPARFFWTDVSLKQRKLNYEAKSLTEFINQGE